MDITARDFYELFCKAVEADDADKRCLRNAYHDNSLYTKKIIERINTIIGSAQCETQNEYFRIDSIGWKHPVLVNNDFAEHVRNVKVNPHLWDLEIAVEHENDPKDWTDELIKLLHVRCPLKVIIAYAPKNERADHDRARLDYAEKLMKEVRAYKNFLESDEAFLIIFGNCGTTQKDIKELCWQDFFGYKGYYFDRGEERFQTIEPQ